MGIVITLVILSVTMSVLLFVKTRKVCVDDITDGILWGTLCIVCGTGIVTLVPTLLYLLVRLGYLVCTGTLLD